MIITDRVVLQKLLNLYCTMSKHTKIVSLNKSVLEKIVILKNYFR